MTPDVPDVAEMVACETCHHWCWQGAIRGSVKRGECRRRSPVVAQIPYRETGDAVWPVTQQGDWCGEYERGESSSAIAERLRKGGDHDAG